MSFLETQHLMLRWIFVLNIEHRALILINWKKVIYCLWPDEWAGKETPLAFCNSRCGKLFVFTIKIPSSPRRCEQEERVMVDKPAFNIEIMTTTSGWSIDEINTSFVLMCGRRKIACEWRLMGSNVNISSLFVLSLRRKRKKIAINFHLFTLKSQRTEAVKIKFH